jgi:serine/threonine protein kinase
MTPPLADIPRTIGRYEIRREIGRGSMGVVYEAHDPGLERRVAVKTIGLAFSVRPDQRQQFEERFFSEARIAARLSHPGIVVVHDMGRDDATGSLYIVLEYLEGRPLSAVAAEGVPLPWREALRLVGQLAEALDYAHSQRVVHRDIKPANVMVLPSGQTKIMDFGIARIETARMKLTMQGQFFGTPLYMSPEQVLGHKLDHRIDIFALGTVCYQLLTGQLAFAGPNLTKIISRVAREDPVPPSYLIPTLPPPLDYLEARALAKDPDDRYPTARALAEDIEDLLAGREPRHRDGWRPAARQEATAEVPPVPGSPVLEGDETDLDLALEPLTEVSVPAPIDVEDVLADLVSQAPPPPPADATVRSATRTVPALASHTHRARPAPARRGVPLWLWGGAVGLLLAFGFLALTVSRHRAVPPAPSSPAATAPEITAPPPASSTPVPRRPAKNAARLEIDFDHSLKSGELRVWIDEELVLEETLDSRVTKKILAYKKRQGSVDEALEVSPGSHTVTVRVAWDGNVKTGRITGTFRAGTTRRLHASLGGLIKKELSLDWE